MSQFSGSNRLPIASSSVLGGVKIGANITVTADGTISVGNASMSAVLINDYGADPTGVNDSLAAFNSALATGKPVSALPGTYKITGTLVNPRKGTLILHAGVTIKPSANFNVIQIKPTSLTFGNGATIDTTGVTAFSSAGIYATGQDRFSVSNELTTVSGFNILGKDHEGDASPTSLSYTGKGIHFYSGNNWAAGYAGQAYIAYIQVSNINITNFYRGIWLEREKTPANGNPWITSCTFDQISMYAAMRSIDITTNDSFYNGGHLFTNIQLQANNYNERYIYTDGSNNRFEGELWDLEDYFVPRNIPCIEFASTAYENTVEATQFLSLDKHVTDNNANPMKPNRFTSLISPVNILPPRITNKVRSFVGDQDDILAAASKAYTVNTSKTPANGTTAIPNAFSPHRGTFLSFTGVDETNNVWVEIDFGSSYISEIDMIGFVFRKDSNNYIPKYIKVEYVDTSGGAYATGTTITNNTQDFWYYQLPWTTGKTYKLRFTFGTSNDMGANRTVRIYRIFATAISQGAGKTWLNAADGGTVYGDVAITGYTKSGNVASLPTADATYRGKMIRVEGGTGVADTVYICMKSSTDTYSWKPIITG